MVKNPIRTKEAMAVTFLHTPLIRAAPSTASTKARHSAIPTATGERKPIYRKSSQALTMKALPVGSISFNIPDSRNTAPETNAQNLRNLLYEGFILQIFCPRFP